MIVEDEPRNAKLLRDLFQKFGYETMEAVDGEQGIAVARLRRPDIILMDIMMPKLDGYEATKVLKADIFTSSIPIIALTANAMRGDKEQLLDSGFNGYIAKPFDIRELLHTVEQYLTGEIIA